MKDLFERIARLSHAKRALLRRRIEAASAAPADGVEAASGQAVGGSPAPISPSSASAQALRALGRGSKRARRLAEHIRQAVISLARLDPEDPFDTRRPLMELGLDSVLAVELSKSLSQLAAVPLPGTVAIDYPTVEALAEHLDGLLESGGAQAVASPAAAARSRRAAVADEPIAIVGMGCRLPGGAEDPHSFWRLLCAATDATGTVPADRWDAEAFFDARRTPGRSYVKRGGFLSNDVGRFDARFFGISPREAASIDPRQRQLLEVCWSALEDAGQAPDALSGSATGVYIGMTGDDYFSVRSRAPAYVQGDPYSGTSTLAAIASGRLSYLLGLRGPSLTLDTACSSALVAVHLAAQALRSGECDLAIAGGTHLLLAPEPFIALSNMQALSPDGRCKSFDASADGYGRGEGCAVIVLRRESDARARRDNIYALLRATAVNQDGRSVALTAPNGPAQAALIADAVAQADVDAAAIELVEAHGTGTPLGDPIEVRSIVSALGSARSQGRHLALGSVKTNLGHLEPVAAMASLIKLALALSHEELPPTLSLSRVNPELPLGQMPLTVPTSRTPWLGGGPRLAGVSSFGFSGTNAHALLEQAPQPSDSATAAAGHELLDDWNLLCLSAKSAAALETLARRYRQHLAAVDAPDLADACFTANTGRAHFEWRLAVAGRSAREVVQRLDELAAAWAAGTRELAAARGGGLDELDAAAQQLSQLDVAARAEALARHYESGGDLDFESIDGGRARRRVPLPTYPFEGAHHWVPEVAAAPGDLVELGGAGADGASLAEYVARLVSSALGMSAEAIAPDASLLDLGLDSLAGAGVLQAIRRDHDVDLPATVLFDDPSVSKLAAAITAARGGAAETAIDFWAEGALDAAIVPSAAARAAASDELPRDVLFLGATSFLGAFALGGLLDQTDVEVTCLVRASDDAPDERAALARVRATLERCVLWRDEFSERLSVVLGDLSSPRMGLAERYDYDALAARIDGVYHFARSSNWALPYARVKPVNVDGMVEVLAFCCAERQKVLHYNSSVTCLGHGVPEDGAQRREETPPYPYPERIDTGYSQSKWVAERLVEKARERGLRVSIYRPTLLAAASETGVFNAQANQLYSSFFVGCVQLGIFPALNPVTLAAPVDYVANAIIALSRNVDWVGRSFNLSSPTPPSADDLLAGLRASGYSLEKVAYEAWRARALTVDRANALFAFNGFFAGLPEDTVRYLAGHDSGHLPYDQRNVDAGLQGSGVACPPMEARRIKAFLAHLCEIGVLEAPDSP